MGSELADRFDRMARDDDHGPTARDEIDHLLDGLGKSIGVRGLALDEHGVALLRIDGTTELLLSHEPELPGLIVSAPLDDVPNGDAAHLRIMLQANMSWHLTRGGIFGLMPENDRPALFWLLLTHDGDLERIERELSEMVAYAQRWQTAFADPPDVDVERQPRHTDLKA